MRSYNMKVKGYIQRKTMLYKTGVEYGDYTMNHVLGCSHGCKYPCYAFMMKKRFGKVKDYEEWIQPYLVSNTLDLLDKEIPKYKSKIKSVQLCFSTDPFMFDYDDVENMSLKAIEILNQSNIKCVVLTKGILPKSLASFSKINEYGITLVSVDENYRELYEPHSAPIKERIKALKYLHELGCKTWVSIEPYPTPNIFKQELDDILQEISFVDKIIFGRLNYNTKVREYKNYREYYNLKAEEVINFCEKNNIDYHIKDKTISVLE